MDVQQYFRAASLGIKLYLVKEKLEDLPKALEFTRRLYYLDLTVKIIIGVWLFNKLVRYLEPQWFLE